MKVDDLRLFQIAICNSGFFQNRKPLKLLMKLGDLIRSPDCTLSNQPAIGQPDLCPERLPG